MSSLLLLARPQSCRCPRTARTGVNDMRLAREQRSPCGCSANGLGHLSEGQATANAADSRSHGRHRRSTHRSSRLALVGRGAASALADSRRRGRDLDALEAGRVHQVLHAALMVEHCAALVRCPRSGWGKGGGGPVCRVSLLTCSLRRSLARRTNFVGHALTDSHDKRS